MALLDFLKKKELKYIDELNRYIDELNEYIAQLESKLNVYQPIIDVESEVQKLNIEKNSIEDDISALKSKYKTAYDIYKDLKHKTELFTESLDLAEYGVYEPHFDFDTSELYKMSIITEREEQKQLIKDNMAVMGGETITWNSSLSQGQAMVKKQKKLMLRAFNGECDGCGIYLMLLRNALTVRRIAKHITVNNFLLDFTNIIHVPDMHMMPVL